MKSNTQLIFHTLIFSIPTLVTPIWLLLLCMMLSWSAPALAENSNDISTVTVVGEAIIIDNDIPRAKKRALQEAFSAALAKTMGSFVSAESFTHNYESLERGVFSRTEGYIKNYNVLSEAIDAGIVQLNVKVSVSISSIKDDLTALGILIDNLGNPGIYVEGQDEGLQQAQSAEVIKMLLANKGFQVLAHRTDADIVVSSKGKILTQSEIGGMIGVVSSIEIRADWSNSGYRINSRTHQSNGAGPSVTHALKAAYKTTTTQVFPAFLDSVLARWQDELTNGRTIGILVHSQNIKSIQQFRHRLSKLFGVKKATIKSFTGKSALVNTKYVGTTATLAELVNRVDFSDSNLTATITKMNNNQIEILLILKSE